MPGGPAPVVVRPTRIGVVDAVRRLWHHGAPILLDSQGCVPVVRLPGGESTVVDTDISVTRAGALRLRRRSAWVGALQGSLGGGMGIVGQVLRGRWKPDLITHGSRDASFLAALIANGARFKGAGTVQTHQGGEDAAGTDKPVSFVELDLGGQRHVVFPELLGKLSCHVLFRARDSALVSLLRLKALEWCKSRGVDSRDAALCIPSTVALACLPSTPEQVAEEVLRSRSMVGHVTLPWARHRGGEGWWKASR